MLTFTEQLGRASQDLSTSSVISFNPPTPLRGKSHFTDEYIEAQRV